MEGLKRLKCVFLYSIFYMSLFAFLEKQHVKYFLIHTKLDDMIPFCEFFVIPYLVWFIFVALTVLYFAFFCEDRKEYNQLVWSLGIGMTVFIVFSFVFPNGQDLRPRLMGEDGIFIDLVKMVYAKDTPTNIFPSIHVYNSVACCLAILNNERCRKHVWVVSGTVLLTVLIVISTVLIKQHSVIDLIGALVLNVLVARGVYKPRNVYSVKVRRVVS